MTGAAKMGRPGLGEFLERVGRVLQRRDVASVVALLVFLGSFVHAMGPGVSAETVHSDYVAPLLMARDCLEGGVCFFQINPFGDSTGLGVQHGAMFNHLLTLLLALGDPLQLFPWVSTGLAALATTLFYLFAARRWGVQSGLMAVMVFGLFWLVACPLAPFVVLNPSLLSLPLVVFTIAAASYIFTRQLRFLAVAAFAVAIGAQAHAAALFLLPSLVYLAAGAPRGSRFSHSIVAMLAVWGTIQVGSPAMLVDTYLATLLLDRGLLLLGAAIGAVGYLTVLVVVARRYSTGMLGLGLFLLITQGLSFVGVSIMAPGVYRYAFPFMPGTALLLFILATAVQRWLIGRGVSRQVFGVGNLVVASLLVIALVAPLPNQISERLAPPAPSSAHTRGVFSWPTAEHLANFLSSERDLTYAQVFRHLRGGAGFWELLGGLASYMPREAPREAPRQAERATGDAPANDFAVFSLPGGFQNLQLPQGWTRVAGEASDPVLLREYTPYLHWDRVERCHLSLSGEETCEWVAVNNAFFPRVHPEDRSLLAARSCPVLPGVAYSGVCPGVTLLRIAVRIPVDGESRALLLSPPADDGHPYGGCQKRFVSVEGVLASGRLPGDLLVVRGGELAQEGFVTVAWAPCDPGCDSPADSMPPALVELDAASAALLAKIYGEPEYQPAVAAFGGDQQQPDEPGSGLTTEATATVAISKTLQVPVERLGLAQLAGELREIDPGGRNKEPVASLRFLLVTIFVLLVASVAAVVVVGSGPHGSPQN